MALTKDSALSTALSIASTASNSGTAGSNFSISSYYDAILRIRMGRGTGTAFTTAPIASVELSPVGSPTIEQWAEYAAFQSAVGASIANQNQSSGGAAGASTVTLAAGTNFAAGDYVFAHNATIGNSEWQHVLSVSSATLTFRDTLVRAQQSATPFRDQSEQYVMVIPAAIAATGRIYIDGGATGQAVIYAAEFFGETGL